MSNIDYDMVITKNLSNTEIYIPCVHLLRREFMNSIVRVSKNIHSSPICLTDPKQWLLLYCTGGEIRITGADKTGMICREGQLTVIPPLAQCSMCASEDYSDISVCMEQISFHCKKPFVLSDHPQRHLHALFEQAYCYASADPRTYLLLDSIGDTITNHILILGKDTGYSGSVEHLWKQITKHYDDAAFALDEAIRQMPFHYDYIRKLFKKETGLSPLEYMTELRMRKAKTLLTAPCARNCSVAEIAYQCGFDDPLYFSRVFRKNYGICPSMFSEQYQNI